MAIVSSPIIVGECVHLVSTTIVVDWLLVPVELSDEGASVVYHVFDEQLYLHILVLRHFDLLRKTIYLNLLVLDNCQTDPKRLFHIIVLNKR